MGGVLKKIDSPLMDNKKTAVLITPYCQIFGSYNVGNNLLTIC